MDKIMDVVDKAIELSLWPPYLYTIGLHYVVVTLMGGRKVLSRSQDLQGT